MQQIDRKHLPVYRIPWTKALEWSRALVRQLREEEAEVDGVFAVARGGWFPGTLVSVALDLPLVSHPTEVDRCLVVDDDCASGETLARYVGTYNHTEVLTAVVHTRWKADQKVIPAYWGAKEQAPEGHRLVWPWQEGPCRLDLIKMLGGKG